MRSATRWRTALHLIVDVAAFYFPSLKSYAHVELWIDGVRFGDTRGSVNWSPVERTPVRGDRAAG